MGTFLSQKNFCCSSGCQVRKYIESVLPFQHYNSTFYQPARRRGQSVSWLRRNLDRSWPKIFLGVAHPGKFSFLVDPTQVKLFFLLLSLKIQNLQPSTHGFLSIPLQTQALFLFDFVFPFFSFLKTSLSSRGNAGGISASNTSEHRESSAA